MFDYVAQVLLKYIPNHKKYSQVTTLFNLSIWTNRSSKEEEEEEEEEVSNLEEDNDRDSEEATAIAFLKKVSNLTSTSSRLQMSLTLLNKQCPKFQGGGFYFKVEMSIHCNRLDNGFLQRVIQNALAIQSLSVELEKSKATGVEVERRMGGGKIKASLEETRKRVERLTMRMFRRMVPMNDHVFVSDVDGLDHEELTFLMDPMVQESTNLVLPPYHQVFELDRDLPQPDPLAGPQNQANLRDLGNLDSLFGDLDGDNQGLEG
ncbi:unnamed protein product [Ilex paraguariensis]|uniref:Uncharacterized protein n=1 Tax=Ilex paraguariensis TaxID=185542 RepID=A0ABC8V1T1_9AQUA